MSKIATSDGIRLDQASPTTAPASSTLHSRIGVATYLSLQLLGTWLPVAAGFALFGWRAIGATAAVVGSALVALLVLRRVGWRGRQMRISHCLWLATFVALMLPAHLFSLTPVAGLAVWPLLPAAGITLALLSWVLGGLGAQRVPPSVVTVLILFVFFHGMLTPGYALRIDRLFSGDLLNVDPNPQAQSHQGTWFAREPKSPYDAVRRDPPGDDLLAYTSAQQRPERSAITMQTLIRDQMPPLENLIIGGESAAIGIGSALAVILGGLFLLYQGLIDFRIPLLGTVAAAAALVVLPVPIFITDTATEWRWLALRPHYLGWAVDLTFVNYELLASPLLFTLFYLAATPGLRPMTRRGRVVFALLLGVLSAIFQLYASVAIGPYIALLIVTLLTPTLDRILKPNTLV